MKPSSSGPASSAAAPFREGRTANSANLGRDHHPFSFTHFRRGRRLQAGHHPWQLRRARLRRRREPVHPHDLQATILHLLGLEHTRLTYRYQGRDFRLTDVAGNVVRDILA